MSTSSLPETSIRIKIMSPSPGVPSDLAYDVTPTLTINSLKKLIKNSLECKPSYDQQRLIYRGKILEGDSTIKDALGGNHEKQDQYTLHLVVNQPAPLKDSASVCPQNTVVLQTATAAESHSPFTNNSTTSITPEIDTGRPSTATIRPNTSVLLSGDSGTSRANRDPAEQLRGHRELLERIHGAHRQSIDIGTSSGISIEGLTSRGTEIASPHFPTGPSETGGAAGVSQSPQSSSSIPAPMSSLPGVSMSTQTPEQTTAQNVAYIEALRRNYNIGNLAPTPPTRGAMPTTQGSREGLSGAQEINLERHAATAQPGAPSYSLMQQFIPENSLVYLLKDQFGRPHSLLVGPSGSTPQSSYIYRSDFQNATHISLSNSLNPPPIPPLPEAQHVAGNYGIPTAAFATLAQNNGAFPQAGRPRTAAFQQALGRQPVPRVGGNNINLPRMAQRVRERAGHFWLALKLTLFVVLLAGNGGWKRVIYLGSIALAIFLWQTGLINSISRYVTESIYPPPPPGFQTPTRQNTAGRSNPLQSRDPIDPAQTVQILVDRRDDRIREAVRNAERAMFIFMGSLIPGWHDNRVNAIEREQQAQQPPQREGGAGEQQQAQEAPRDIPLDDFPADAGFVGGML